MSDSYWQICLEEALPDIGIELPQDQFDALVKACDGIAEMEGEATGRYSIPNPLLAEVEEQKRLRKRDLDEHANIELRYREELAKRISPRTEARDIRLTRYGIEIDRW